MYYKYIFFKLYNWSRKGEDLFYPQLGAIYLLTLLFLSNTYLILVSLDLLNIAKYDGKYINSPSALILVIVFISMLLFNHLYFYWINKWRVIINYFKNTHATT